MTKSILSLIFTTFLFFSGCENTNSTSPTQAQTVPIQKDTPAVHISNTLVTAGKSVDFSITDDTNITSIEWRDENGKLLSTDPKFNRLFTEPGEYKTILIVTDENNQTKTEKVIVTVTRATQETTPEPNQPPVVKAKAEALDIMDEESIHLSDDGSYDPDGTIIKYEWRDMDGILLSTSKTLDRVLHYDPQYDFNHDGTTRYVKTLYVTDDKGAVSSKSFTIIVHKKTSTPTPPADTNTDTTPPTTTPSNQVPTALSKTLVLYSGESMVIVLEGSDADGDALSYKIVQQPQHGKLSNNVPNIVYTADAGYVGEDSFTYVVNDGKVDSAPATVHLKVEVQKFKVTLNPPYEFTASFMDNERVDITWQDVTVGEDGYKVYRDGEVIATLGADTTSYSDNTVDIDKIYEYQISVFSGSSEAKSFKTSVLTEKSLGYDENKLVSLDENGTIQKVTNQSWIYSSSLDEAGLKALVAEYPALTVLGFDEVWGLLVEYDEESYDALKALGEIGYSDTIMSVQNRVILDKSILRGVDDFKPNDYDIEIVEEGIKRIIKEKWTIDNPSGENWHLEEMNLPYIWGTFTRGSNNIGIGICDSKFYVWHEDINSSKISTIMEFPVNRKNAITGEVKPLEDSDIYHGNAVLGVIGATQNNKIGIAGINNYSKIYVSSYLFNKINCFEQLQKRYKKDNANTELKVINYSVGLASTNYHTYVPEDIQIKSKYIALDNIYNASKYQQTLFVISAGNNHSKLPLIPSYTHKYKGLLKKDNIIHVAAYLKNGNLASYSNYGKGVDIAAPTKIKSLAEVNDNGNSTYRENILAQYGMDFGLLQGGFGGTSAAAPMVTGIASLMWSIKPDLTPSEVKNILIHTASYDIKKRDKESGYNPETEVISPIPKLDAPRAVRFVNKLIKSQAYIIESYNIPDYKIPKVILKINGKIADNSIITYNLQKYDSNLKKFTQQVNKNAIVKNNKFEITDIDLAENQTYKINTADINGKEVSSFIFDVMALQINPVSLNGKQNFKSQIPIIDELKLTNIGTDKTITINNYQRGDILYLKPNYYDIDATRTILGTTYIAKKAKLNYEYNGEYTFTEFQPGVLTRFELVMLDQEKLKRLKVKVINNLNQIIKNLPIKLQSNDASLSESLTTDDQGIALLSIDSVEDFYKLYVNQNGLEKLVKDKIVLFEDKLQELTVVLKDYVPDAGIVKGTVQDITNNRQPLKNAKVAIYNGENLLKSVQTDTNGNFILEGIPSGITHKIVVSKEGYLDSIYDNVVPIANDTITLETVLQIDEDHSGIGSVSGKITNAISGVGIDGLTLNLRKGINVKDGAITTTTSTDSAGHYEIAELEAGVYTVEAIGEGFITGYFTIISIGNESTDNQNYSITPILPEGETRIVLTWGAIPSDLDSHLTGPIEGSDERFHVYYSNKGSATSSPYSFLDHDDTSSYGPETITIKQQFDGIYRYSVLDYSNRNSTSSSALGNSGAKVKVYRGSSLIHTFNVPNNPGTFWTVFELEGDQIIPINKVEYVEQYHPTRSRALIVQNPKDNLDTVITDVGLMKNLPLKE